MTATTDFDIILKIGSEQIAESEIVDSITVSTAEDRAALMVFTLRPDAGVQNFKSYNNKTITLDIIADAGTYRVFTGIVDYPDMDLINKTISYNCTSNRRKLMESVNYSTVGYYSDAIFNDVETNAERIEQRLQTVAKTLDFDGENNYSFNSIFPKATPDFTLDDADVFYRNPTIDLANVGDMINKVNLTFDFRYPLLRHRRQNFSIGGNQTFCDIARGQGEYISIERATSSAESAGWPVDPDSINALALPNSGHFTCPDAGSFYWVSTPSNANYCISLDFTACYNYAQTVIESYNITVQAPQSIYENGTIERAQKNSLDIDFNTSEFEKNDVYTGYDGFTYDSNDYYLKKDGTDAQFQNAINTAIAIAKTTILKSHRNNVVSFETPLFPNLSTQHTVKVDTDEVVATGKVVSINHNLNVNTRHASSSISIAFSTASGSATDSTITAPSRVALNILRESSSDTIIIDSIEDDLVMPKIDDVSRQTTTQTSSASYDVEIPNTALTVTF